MIALVLTGLSDADATKLALIFGVFYTGLAIAGLTIHHPLGMRLDRGENVFHLLVGLQSPRQSTTTLPSCALLGSVRASRSTPLPRRLPSVP